MRRIWLQPRRSGRRGWQLLALLLDRDRMPPRPCRQVLACRPLRHAAAFAERWARALLRRRRKGRRPILLGWLPRSFLARYLREVS